MPFLARAAVEPSVRPVNDLLENWVPRMTAVVRQDESVVDSASARRERRRARVAREFDADDVESALDVLALVDLAWHDCYGDPSPSEAVLDDLLTVGGGELRSLGRAGLLAVIDSRDLRIAADEVRRG